MYVNSNQAGQTLTYTLPAAMQQFAGENAGAAFEVTLITGDSLKVVADYDDSAAFLANGGTKFNFTIKDTISGLDTINLVFPGHNYKAVTFALSIVATDKTVANPTVTVPAMTYGDTEKVITVTPAAGAPDGPWVFTGGNDSILTVDENGVVTIKKAGSTTVKVSYAGNDTHVGETTVTVTAAKKPVTITADSHTIDINAVTPPLTWFASGELAPGDTLGGVSFEYQQNGVRVDRIDTGKAGVYDIVITECSLTNKESYDIRLVPGKLTVKAPSTPSIPSPVLYTIDVLSSENGFIVPNTSENSAGSPITLTVTPDEGYALSALTVTDSSGNSVELTDIGNSNYTFPMPASNVTVEAAFKIINPFSDVAETDWFYDEVMYAYENSLMEGLPGDIFVPKGSTNRGMIVTILYRLEGKPTITAASSFSDVADGLWYSDAVIWAAENKIVEGWNGKFGPDDPITREQMATILWRYAKYKGIDVSVGEDTNILSYNDGLDVSEYAIPAMQWACGEGIIGGRPGGILAPADQAQRCEVAAILHRYCLLTEE